MQPVLEASFLFAAYFIVDWKMATDMHERHVTRVDPTVLYTSVFMGLYEFGLAGIIYGPLLVLMGTVVYHAVNFLPKPARHRGPLRKVKSSLM